MKVYVDVFSGEEIISDSFNIVELFEGAGGEVKSKLVVKGGVEVDIGCGNAFGGKNEEDEEEAAGGNSNPNVEKVVDLIDAFKYQETQFTKGEYTTYIKGYMKKVKEQLEKTNPDRVKPFMTGATAMVKFILGQFNEFTFYCPESYDTDNIIILSYYKGEDAAPTFLYFMDGLKETKF